MRTISALRAAGTTDPGRQREVNEDRLYLDASRGLFMVIDGVGGQAAGGKAADIALTMLRARMERETGPLVERVREAITIANNEIHRVAGLRPEWNGMACVLTVAVVDDTRAIVGHVGDTRLYKVRDDRIHKVTHDHSPVGEREDSGELSEFEAMHHPRRNEVYRDVGSEPHQPADPDFIDVVEVPFEPDAALLLCSDGLTDVIESSSIKQIVGQHAGEPHQVVTTLIEAANAAGGKDNVTVVYVEGEQFAAKGNGAGGAIGETAQRLSAAPADQRSTLPATGRREQGTLNRAAPQRRAARAAVVALLAVIVALAAFGLRAYWPGFDWRGMAPPAAHQGRIVVGATASIAEALQRAAAGSEVVVEPGEYHETLVLRSGVRLVSRVPRGATIRLPGTGSEADPAVVAADVTGAELVGFRIVGDAATPLGTGVLVRNAELSIVDVEVTGAVAVAIDIKDRSRASIVAADIHDNPGAGLALRAGASTRIAHNVFVRNGVSERVPATMIIEENADARFAGNVFHGISPKVFGRLGEAARMALARDNWFVDAPDLRSPAPTSRRLRRGR
jgi:serine/threonine protein phosphatase PrpC